MIHPIPIVAEVLDKEPSIVTIWILFGLIALTGFLLCRYWRWWLALIPVFVTLILAYAFFEEYSSVGLPSSGESRSYLAQFFVAVGCAVLLPIIGAAINFAKHPVIGAR